MSTRAGRKLFVNLPVADLVASMRFFSRLGFEFDRRFTDDRAACMVLGPEAFVMLLTRPFFRSFTHKALCDTAMSAEALMALSCPRRAEVDELLAKAVAAGGTASAAPHDHVYMYAGSFQDLDGHHWEVVWLDPHLARA